MSQRCECPDRSDPRYHGGQAECPREAADHGSVITSPALCLPCLHGCEIIPDPDLRREFFNDVNDFVRRAFEYGHISSADHDALLDSITLVSIRSAPPTPPTLAASSRPVAADGSERCVT